MKKSELKQIIREILSEQLGGPNTGLNPDGSPAPFISSGTKCCDNVQAFSNLFEDMISTGALTGNVWPLDLSRKTMLRNCCEKDPNVNYYPNE